VKDAVLERALAELDTDGGGPPADWQERVSARIEVVPPAPRRARWPFVAAGSGLIVAAAAVVLFVALRSGPDAPPAAPPEGRAAYDRVMRDIDRLEAEAQYQQALRAVTEAEKAAAQTELDRAKEEANKVGNALDGLKGKARKSRSDAKARDRGRAIVAKCDANDPLCAIE
jgi:hypothetical protein